MPIEDINGTFRAYLNTKANQCHVVGRQKIVPVLPNKTRSIGDHYIRQHGMFVDVAHEQPAVVFFGESICQVESRTTMGGQMGVIANRLNVIVNMWVEMRPALLVVNSPLNHVKQMRNDATGSETLALIIEIKTPRIGQTASKYFKRPTRRVVTPNATIDELAVFFLLPRFTNMRHGENAVASVQPAVGAPDKTVQRFMPVVDPPAVQ